MSKLRFEPKYHVQITEGEFSGAWVGLVPPAGSETDMAANARYEEYSCILAEGGSVVVYDPVGGAHLRDRVMAAARAVKD